jgi:tyrosinase
METFSEVESNDHLKSKDPKKLKVRQSLLELQEAYYSGKNKKPLEDLMRAWKGIKELPADHPKSFFMLGGFHGEPFRGAGWGNSSYWGGYCNHGNVLFPTWHRVYVLKLEEALQSITGCEDVMLPFWDQTDPESLKNGIPRALTDENFELDGVLIPNPLRSFKFPRNITDHISGDNPNYSKPAGYETVRYPLSGLVGNNEEIEKTNEHNAKYPNYEENVKILDSNIVDWLTSTVINYEGKTISTSVKKKYEDCLKAPNYTIFSNTTSASEWNSQRQTIDPSTGAPIENDLYKKVVPIESPHNSIHLAVGGFDIPGSGNQLSKIPDANGDMGENDTAGLDPIFHFHHCNIDRVFWLWQKKHGFTDHLEIIPEYPGTNTVDSQGPTPGKAPNSWLTLETTLDPFKLVEEDHERYYTSLDCINIEKQLGYTYGSGSLEQPTVLEALVEGYKTKMIQVSQINKAPIRGSFLISAYAEIDGKVQHIGTEAVLSRWNSKYCANCQTHIEVKAHFELPVKDEHLENGILKSKIHDSIEIKILGRDGLLNDNANELLKSNGKRPVNYRFDVL